MLPAMTSVQSVRAGPPRDVAIVGFGKTVHVFSSKQQPKKLVIYADDFRDYDWIVKGGEELRIDQRVEQLLDVMNGLLAQHPPSRAHNLQVQTYDVIPMSESLGMVLFVPGTLPLLAAITQPSLISPQELVAGDQAYSKHIDQAGKSDGKTPLGQRYERLIQHASELAAARGLAEAQAHVRWDALREMLLRNSGGPETFFADRGRLAASLATLCITGYVAGVGDRHLDNFLLHTPSGRLVPIDFGYSFGTATQVLPVPELMPFRLTRQLAGALLPHEAPALLHQPCSAALGALRAGHDILEGILACFLREPLLDWQREAVAIQGSRQGGNVPSSADIAQHSRAKIDATRRKLAGCHPSEVMLGELEARHATKPHWAALQRIVKGMPGGRQPMQGRPSEQLSCEDQAACLLAMATDPNILGRTWQGWRPWL